MLYAASLFRGLVEVTISFQMKTELHLFVCVGTSFNSALPGFLLDAWPEVSEELASRLISVARSQGRFGLGALN